MGLKFDGCLKIYKLESFLGFYKLKWKFKVLSKIIVLPMVKRRWFSWLLTLNYQDLASIYWDVNVPKILGALNP